MIRAAAIARAERVTGEDAGWMRDVATLGTAAFLKLAGFLGFANLRRGAPIELLALARLGAVTTEDCGACTRIVLRMAKREGVAAGLLQSALGDGRRLSEPQTAALQFGRLIAARSPDANSFGDAIEHAFGRKVRTELAIAAATARVYPALKRGLGYAQSCAPISVAEL